MYFDVNDSLDVFQKIYCRYCLVVKFSIKKCIYLQCNFEIVVLLLFFIFISLINSFICLKSEQSAQLFLQKSSKSSSKHSWNSSLILKAFYRKRAIFKNLTNFSWSVFKSLSASVFDNSSLKKYSSKIYVPQK